MAEWLLPAISRLHHTTKKTVILQQRTFTQHRRHMRDPHSHMSEGVEAGGPLWGGGTGWEKTSPKDCDLGPCTASEREGRWEGAVVHRNIKVTQGPLHPRGKPLPKGKLMQGWAHQANTAGEQRARAERENPKNTQKKALCRHLITPAEKPGIPEDHRGLRIHSTQPQSSADRW